MRTLVICLSILLMALIIGFYRQPHLGELKSELAKQSLSPPRERTNIPGDSSQSNRIIRSHRTKSSLSPSTALTTYLEHKNFRTGVNSGAGAVLNNQEAFSEIMKLDLAGQREFIRLVLDSNTRDFRYDLYRCEAINLCLCAMADRNPEEALNYLLKAEQKIAKWYVDTLEPNAMIHYTLLRLSQENHNLAAATISGLTDRDWKALEDGGYPSAIIQSIAERDLELALQTIKSLPVEQQAESWRSMINQAETKEEVTQTLNAVRQSPIEDSDTVDMMIAPLLTKARDPNKPWSSFAVWLDKMQLTPEEANRYARAIVQTAKPGSDQAEVAAWLANSAAPSKERDILLWQTTQGYWEGTDPESAASFLQSQGIDPEEMRKLEQQGISR